ncbi:MAG: hypothetical protein J6586_06265 [Snodgrassella sp.]|nr:hypothetical protein [Snodgrassella sp.]
MNFIKLSVMVLNVWLMLKSIEDKLRQQAKHYNKTYLGEMLYVDSKRLPLLKNEKNTREYLCVGIDDLLRELYADIYSTNPNLA